MEAGEHIAAVELVIRTKFTLSIGTGYFSQLPVDQLKRLPRFLREVQHVFGGHQLLDIHALTPSLAKPSSHHRVYRRGWVRSGSRGHPGRGRDRIVPQRRQDRM